MDTSIANRASVPPRCSVATGFAGAASATARHAYLALLLALLAAGCQSLGMTGPDREQLEAMYAADAASRFVDVDGTRVHVRDEGEGPAVVMIHGALASLHGWDGWAEAFREQYRVIRLDLPPFGLSGAMPEGRYDEAAYVEFLDAVFDELDVDRAALVGHSLGGYFAARYAKDRPERVHALVLVSPAGYPQPVPWPIRLYATPIIGGIAERVTPRSFVRRGLRSAHGDPDTVDDAIVDRYFHLIIAPGNRPAMRPLFAEIMNRRDREPEWVNSIRTPTLLLWGREDDWVPLALSDRWLADLPHATRIVYAGVGHIPMEEIPEQSARDAMAFLDTTMTRANTPNTGWLGVRFGMPARGATAERHKDVSLTDIELFSEMTGDRNPLHTDREAAEASRFGGLIVQGGVTTGILNAVVAEDLPGPGTVFLGVEWKFLKPVYVGDRITGRVTITDVREDKPICTIETQVINQHGETCLAGTATTYTAALDQ